MSSSTVGRDREAQTRAYGDDQTRVVVAALDLLSPAHVETCVRAIVDRFGVIDVLCNLAGGFQMGERVHETPAAAWEKMSQELRDHDINVKCVLPSIIDTASNRSRCPTPIHASGSPRTTWPP